MPPFVIFWLVIAAVLLLGRFLSWCEDLHRDQAGCPPHDWLIDSDAAGTSYQCTKCGCWLEPK